MRSHREDGDGTEEREAMEAVIAAARKYRNFTGGPPAMFKALDELDAIRSASGKCSGCEENPRIGVGVFSEFCRPCAGRPCGNCGDEGHAKWECALPPEAQVAKP